MGMLDRFLGRRRAAPPAPAPVRCPACGERNPPFAEVCSICRGPLPKAVPVAQPTKG